MAEEKSLGPWRKPRHAQAELAQHGRPIKDQLRIASGERQAEPDCLECKAHEESDADAEAGRPGLGGAIIGRPIEEGRDPGSADAEAQPGDGRAGLSQGRERGPSTRGSRYLHNSSDSP